MGYFRLSCGTNPRCELPKGIAANELAGRWPGKYVNRVSKLEIIAELPNLSAEDRSLLLEQLIQLQEQDVVRGIAPSEREQHILDQALAEFERDGHPGRPWREVLQKLSATPAA